MAHRCSVCGEAARYVVGMEIRILDLDSTRDRIKQINMYLCEECEGRSRDFLARDRGQAKRVAGAICQEHEVNGGMGAFWARAPGWVEG